MSHEYLKLVVALVLSAYQTAMICRPLAILHCPSRSKLSSNCWVQVSTSPMQHAQPPRILKRIARVLDRVHGAHGLRRDLHA